VRLELTQPTTVEIGLHALVPAEVGAFGCDGQMAGGATGDEPQAENRSRKPLIHGHYVHVRRFLVRRFLVSIASANLTHLLKPRNAGAQVMASSGA
jgi:hypothetical protein